MNMKQSDELPRDLLEDKPVPLMPEDIDTLRDALQSAVSLWE
jgi:hypothetical protein